MLSCASTATPVGALNCPLPSPFEPKLNRKSPSESKIWREGKEKDYRVAINLVCSRHYTVESRYSELLDTETVQGLTMYSEPKLDFFSARRHSP